VAKIAASMAKFGWTVPCMVADDGELIAGHGRVLAAAMLGLTEVPVIRLSHLDEAERRAYRIADNKLTELGEWDEAMLRDEIAGLLAEDFDLTLLGISRRGSGRPAARSGGGGRMAGRGRGRCSRTTGHAGVGAGRPLAAGVAPADLRRQHRGRCGRAAAR
jgi:hypothetical protein